MVRLCALALFVGSIAAPLCGCALTPMRQPEPFQLARELAAEQKYEEAARVAAGCIAFHSMRKRVVDKDVWRIQQSLFAAKCYRAYAATKRRLPLAERRRLLESALRANLILELNPEERFFEAAAISKEIGNVERRAGNHREAFIALLRAELFDILANSEEVREQARKFVESYDAAVDYEVAQARARAQAAQAQQAAMASAISSAAIYTANQAAGAAYGDQYYNSAAYDVMQSLQYSVDQVGEMWVEAEVALYEQLLAEASMLTRPDEIATVDESKRVVALGHLKELAIRTEKLAQGWPEVRKHEEIKPVIDSAAALTSTQGVNTDAQYRDFAARSGWLLGVKAEQQPPPTPVVATPQPTPQPVPQPTQPAPPPAKPVSQAMAELGALYQSGQINLEEYKARRKALLDAQVNK